MILTDTHTHLYLNAFDEDRKAVVEKALAEDVKYMLLPNIDSSSVENMLGLCDEFPQNCFPMMGLHPTSVKDNFEEELEKVKSLVKQQKFIAIGEIGIDLYWDKSFFNQQEKAFRFQLDLALEHDLPVAIHIRDSFDEVFGILNDYKEKPTKGVFHCFTGNTEQAWQAIDLGFHLGIGGVLTFKNGGIVPVVENVPLKHLLLETDAPFLAPVPFRGKRNESSYINLIARKIAEVKKITKEEVAEVTTQNAINLFKFIY